MTTTPLPQNPFPGMNPYLEQLGIWPEVHNKVIVGLSDLLSPQLQPDYVVRTAQRVYIDAEAGDRGTARQRIPDAMILADGTIALRPEIAAAEPKPGASAVAVALPATELVRQRYLQVLRADNLEVVAVIEVLSPSNKSGHDRDDYLAKRAEVESSTAHLIEIDLLRGGTPTPVIGDAPLSCYRIIVANGRLRPQAYLYAFDLPEPIPEFTLPLAQGAPGVRVDLNQVLGHVYSHGSYNMFINYQTDPTPPLSDADRAWLDQMLRERGLRNGGGA